MASDSIGYVMLWFEKGVPDLSDFAPQWTVPHFGRSEVSWVPLLGVCLPAMAPPAKLALSLMTLMREETAEDVRLLHLPFNL